MNHPRTALRVRPVSLAFSHAVFAVVIATCGVTTASVVGCSSTDDGGGGAGGGAGGGGGGGTGLNCDEAKDPQNPPIACGPVELGDAVCSAVAQKRFDSCPSDNPCMAQVKQTGDVANLRIGRLKLWYPNSLQAVAKIAIDPNVDSACTGNNESFNWLFQIDKKNKKLTTGGAQKVADSKSFSFAKDSINGADLSSICPGFKGPAEPIKIEPFETPITFVGSKFNAGPLAKLNVPIFSTAPVGGAAPIPLVLPLSEVMLKDVELSADGTCIGAFDKKFGCGSSRGWTTGATLLGKITSEDADKVPVRDADCKSLCALLAQDTDKLALNPDTKKYVCKRGADGKIPEIGDTCVGGESCKNAFRLSATFSAYGVNIK